MPPAAIRTTKQDFQPSGCSCGLRGAWYVCECGAAYVRGAGRAELGGRRPGTAGTAGAVRTGAVRPTAGTAGAAWPAARHVLLSDDEVAGSQRLHRGAAGHDGATRRVNSVRRRHAVRVTRPSLAARSFRHRHAGGHARSRRRRANHHLYLLIGIKRRCSCIF